jgi:hypothetical protein
MNGELRRTKKTELMVHLKLLFCDMAKGFEAIYEILSQDNWCPGRDSNRAPPE